MQIICASSLNETRNFISSILYSQGIYIRELKNISTDDIFNIPDNEIILITDEVSYLKQIESSIYSVKNVIKVFLSNLFNDPFLLKLTLEKKDLMLSYKARDLANTVKVLMNFQSYQSASDIILDISSYEYPPTSKIKKRISGNLKYIPRDAINYINKFMKENEINKTLDVDNVIIASSEIIDNIIEIYVKRKITTGNIDIEIQLSKNLFSITISDFFGEADIYNISKSISLLPKNGKRLFEEELQRQRGRGYTIIRKTTDRIITLIVRHDTYHKYLFNSPQTSVAAVYYPNKKTSDERLNTIIEFG